MNILKETSEPTNIEVLSFLSYQLIILFFAFFYFWNTISFSLEEGGTINFSILPFSYILSIVVLYGALSLKLRPQSLFQL
jgi:hypothetical protein